MPPHKVVQSKTIARWVLSFIQESGIDATTFGAHSTRSASTSHAIKVRLSIGDIGKAAEWSSGSTFRKHYNRPMETNFGASILSNVM